MPSTATAKDRTAGTPSGGNPPETDLRSVATSIEGLLDDDGHFNPNPEQLSRGHPDYVEADDDRANKQRDSKGRFQKSENASTEELEDSETAIEEVDDDRDTDQDADPTETDGDEEVTSEASDDAQTDETDTDTQDTIQTLVEMAEALDVSVDELKAQITHSFKAADEDVTVTLAELEKGYQKDADYRRSTAQVAEYRRAVETDMTQRQQVYEQQQHIAASQLNLAEQMVVAELESPQLTAIRDNAPEEWSARRIELGERLQYLRNSRQQAAGAYEQFRNHNRAQLREREMAQLKEAIPDFGEKHNSLAREVISSLGYSSQEIPEIFDNRLIQGALELGALRKRVSEMEAQHTKAKETVKRVKKDIPKLQKPGKSVSPQGQNARLRRDNVKRLQGRLRKSGKVEDAAAVIENML